MQFEHGDVRAARATQEVRVPETPAKLVTLERLDGRFDLERILQLLKEDLVVLIPDVRQDDADGIMVGTADKLGLRETLEIQAGFANIRGHRDRASKYYMTVNKRDDYQFIAPHSEGNTFSNLQLASFFSYENDTDGGETVLMHVDGTSGVWASLRERVLRGSFKEGTLTELEAAQARAFYGVDRASSVQNDDQIIQERESKIRGLRVIDVLARPTKVFSCILSRDLHAYWDSIASIDYDSADQYLALLRQCGLLKEPFGKCELSRLDNTWSRRTWRSGAKYEQIFDCKITKKLTRGDLVILNNVSWAHSVSNWTPGSGKRTVVAAFA